MNIDKEYSKRVTCGGLFDPFRTMRKILNREITNTDLDHLSIAKKEAIAHLELTKLFLGEYHNSKDFTTGIWQERTELCEQYIKFLKQYEIGIDIR